MRQYAHVALLVAAAFWGFGNIAQKTVLEHMGPMTATCLRCAIAALAVLPLLWFERRIGRDSGWWSSALRVALMFAIAISIQQTAYMSVTVTNASFLVNTATILTPLLAWFLFREPTGKLGIGAALATMIGIFLMSNGASGFAEFNWGDGECLVSAVFYALWMVALGRHAQRCGSPYMSAFVQFAVAGLVALPPSIFSEYVSLSGISAAWPELAVLGLFATAAAFCLQTVAQKYTSASKAALLVSGESVFGAIGAVIWLGERPSAMVIAGAMTILAAIVAVSVLPGKATPGLEAKAL